MDKRDGDVFLCAGIILTLTIIGAVIGVPLILIGLAILAIADEPETAEDVPVAE